jgi:methylase of polypeptide subunit release factors
MDEAVLVIAVDSSEDALQLARENAVGHGVADRIVFVAADLFPHHVEPTYTLVCANLPYVPTAELEELAPDLAFEPRQALDGGPDGLTVRRLLERCRMPSPAGFALLRSARPGEAIVREVADRLLAGAVMVALTSRVGRGWRSSVTREDSAGDGPEAGPIRLTARHRRHCGQ